MTELRDEVDKSVPSESHRMVQGSLAFFGNRYSPLSAAFFAAVAEWTGRNRCTLILVDTSTRVQSRLRRRLRNVAVAAVKRLFRVTTPTQSYDWFRTTAARSFFQVTPPNHDINAPWVASELTRKGVGCVFVAGCDQILRAQLVGSFPRIINFHNGRLPEYRGCDAVSWALLKNEREIWYSFHTIENESVDAGRIVATDFVRVSENESEPEVDERLTQIAVAALPSVLDTLVSREWPPLHCEKVTIEAGKYYRRSDMSSLRRIGPEVPADELCRRLRILRSLDLHTRFGVLKVTGLEPLSAITVARIKKAFLIQCNDGSVAEIKTVWYLPARIFGLLLRGSKAFA